MMLQLQTFIVNAFVDPDDLSSIESGNPAGVVLLTPQQDEALPESERLKIAAQLGYSETAFVVALRSCDDVHEFSLRWFTPKVEVDLCGHATLASAAAIVANGQAKAGDELRFHTKHSGTLVVKSNRLQHEQQVPFLMSFPSLPPHSLHVNDGEHEELLAQLSKGLNIDRRDIEECYESKYDLLVVVKDVQVVRQIVLNRSALMAIESRGVIVASGVRQGNEGCSLASRFFAPRVGVDEDAVTGSAHCVLACVFTKEGGAMVRAKQLSTRGGTVMVGRSGKDGTRLGGWTRIVLRGSLQIWDGKKRRMT